MTPDDAPASPKRPRGREGGPEALRRGTPLDRLFALERFGIKLGLDNIRTLTAALGNPEDTFASIHIAGTNGKGSTAAMVERALRGRQRTGRYTSPHLDRIEERIAIDGLPVETAQLVEVAAMVLDTVDTLRRHGRLETSPTFFEVTTAIAFEMFRRAAIDVGVIEVGLGGRFDATNVMTPRVTAITSIGFDHERHLGSSLSSIAFEKAGILKRGVPAVIGQVPAEARTVIEQVAGRAGAPVVPAGLDLVADSTLTAGRATISVATPVRIYREVTLGLNGAHQVANAVVAIRVLELAEAAGLRIGAENIVAGLRDVTWPARLEWLRLPDGRELLIDAAHNPDGAEALARYLGASGAAPLPLVLAVMKDKDVDGIVRPLVPLASRFVATSVPGERALPAAALAARIRRLAQGTPVDSVAEPHASVQATLGDAPRAAAAGSIFFVGPLRARLVAGGAVSFSR